MVASVKAPSVAMPKHADRTPGSQWCQRTRSTAITTPATTFTRNAGPSTVSSRMNWNHRIRWIAIEASTAAAAM